MTTVAYWGPNTGKVNDAVSKMLERIFLGDQTVEESLAQAETDVNAASADSNVPAESGRANCRPRLACVA